MRPSILTIAILLLAGPAQAGITPSTGENIDIARPSPLITYRDIDVAPPATLITDRDIDQLLRSSSPTIGGTISISPGATLTIGTGFDISSRSALIGTIPAAPGGTLVISTGGQISISSDQQLPLGDPQLRILADNINAELPEPGSLTMLLASLGLLNLRRRKRA